MQLRELEYVVAIADHGQFGRAAEACHVGQSTLSVQVKKLEDWLGVAIFERDNRRVLVTAPGALIVERARAVLREAAAIREIAAAARDPLAGEFRLGVFPTLAPYFLPRVAPAIAKELPKIHLLLIEEKTPELLRSLAAGEIDAAILALPCGDGSLESHDLFEDEFLLAVPAGHPLTTTKKLRQSDLLGHELLLLEDGHCLRDQALAICSRSGTSERQDFRATSLETLRSMVAAGSGITLMPAIAVRDDATVRYLRFADRPVPSRRIGIVWRATTARRELLERVAKIVRNDAPARGVLAMGVTAQSASLTHADSREKPKIPNLP